MGTNIYNTNLAFESAPLVRAANCIDNLAYMYTEFFHCHPTYQARFNLDLKSFNDKIDMRNNLLKELLDDGFVLYDAKYSYSSGNCYDRPYVYEDDDLDFDNEKTLYIENYSCVSENVLIYVESSDVFVLSHENVDKIKHIGDKYILKHDKVNYDAKCYMIAYSDYLYLNKFEIKLDGPINFELYNDGFEDTHNEIMNSIKNDKNGLYILHGKPGTGKTTYIRHLIKEYEIKYGHDKRFVYIPSSLVGELTSPRFVSFLMENKNCIFILEDCENLVVETDDGKRTSIISDMLNMTDGILSDALQMKFIVTFNTEEKNIDKALLREGRCRMKYEFDLLKKDRANKIAEKNNLNSVSEDISLAELFNGKNRFKNDTKKKIGFGA